MMEASCGAETVDGSGYCYERFRLIAFSSLVASICSSCPDHVSAAPKRAASAAAGTRNG